LIDHVSPRTSDAFQRIMRCTRTASAYRKGTSNVPIRAVLFDIDGTLVGSHDMHVLAWEEAFAAVGANFNRRTIYDQIGKGTDMLVPTLLPDADEVEQEKLGKMQGDVFKAKFLKQVKRFPGAHDLLACVPNAAKAARGAVQPRSALAVATTCSGSRREATARRRANSAHETPS
jgi:beta-phosphoglucomutase-like phosphatase (HAD superfamily)